MTDIKTYDDFKSAFDEFDNPPRITPSDYESPLRKLSRFSQEHPRTYERYRRAMRAEQNNQCLEKNRLLDEGQLWRD